jgi:hypothetical protein
MRKSEKTPAERRRFPVGLNPRRLERQEQAKVRQIEYDALTKEQKVARAKARPGESARELRRLEQ